MRANAYVDFRIVVDAPMDYS
ncbi:hypothetical protein PSAC2689_160174 [Paraburkholderia sacchari]